MLRFLNCRGDGRRAAAGHETHPAAIFAGAFIRRINHNGSDSRYSGTDTLFVGDHCHAHLRGQRGRARESAGGIARRSAGGTFTVSKQEAPRNSAAAGSLRAISTVDALIALQGVEDPAERKKRAVVKGRNALYVLDKLKLGLLDGSVDGSTLARLKVAAEGLNETTGDAGLDTVQGEIDLREAVELAKASRPAPQVPLAVASH